MVAKHVKTALLLSAFALAFAYRFILMTGQVFPPGSDIGLHESVIKTITSGQTNFFVNLYHMGGGVSATNPGYHIFASFIIAMTGMPDYIAQSVIACLFSTFIVFCVFLFVRQVWNKNAAYVAAFLTVFCGGDIAMLCWGGYPNIIALMLIPLVFYFFLQKSRFSSATFLVATSLLVGSLFLTHIFSAFILIAITVFAILINAFLSKKTKFSKRQAMSWLIPIVIGALLVSPYLYNVIPVYFSSGGNITGASLETTQALLETRAVSISVAIISIMLGLTFFVISKFYLKKFVTVQAILCVAWVIVPIVLTQSYIFGFYLDYERFLYFLYFPLIVFTTLLIVSLAQKLPHLSLPKKDFKIITVANFPKAHSRKALISLLVTGLLIASLFYSPLLTAPNEAIEEATYYQKMTPLKYDAIQWIKNSTPENSVFVADADYGWWISGFAQRPTLSAINPQFLILSHELEPARAAKNLLTTDYFIDNGKLKINYNVFDNKTNSHELYARIIGSYVLHPFFSIKDTNISLLYRNNGKPQYLSLNKLTITNVEVNNGSNWASFTTVKENELLRFSESLTIQAGSNIAKVNMTIQGKTSDIQFDWLYVPFIANGAPTEHENSIVFTDGSIQSQTSIGFAENQLGNTVSMKENTEFYELILNNQGSAVNHFEFTVEFNEQEPSENTQNQSNSEFSYSQAATDSNQQLTYFDYKKTINVWNISYVLVTDEKAFSRFAGHESFNLVYKNAEAAIFKVYL